MSLQEPGRRATARARNMHRNAPSRNGSLRRLQTPSRPSGCWIASPPRAPRETSHPRPAAPGQRWPCLVARIRAVRFEMVRRKRRINWNWTQQPEAERCRKMGSAPGRRSVSPFAPSASTRLAQISSGNHGRRQEGASSPVRVFKNIGLVPQAVARVSLVYVYEISPLILFLPFCFESPPSDPSL